MNEIKFEKNDKMKINKLDDWKLYTNSLDYLEDLQDKDVYLLKDDRTEFKAFKEGFIEDIKSVFLIVRSKEINIKIKGNLSFNRNSSELKFWPIFVDRFSKEDEHFNYWYKVNINKFNDLKLLRSERQLVNESEFKKLLIEFKSNKYTPPIATKEWTDFIHPYEYFAELKFELLKQDFIMIDTIPQDLLKVILLDRKNPQFKNYFERELYLDIYEDNRKSFLILDYNEHKNSFDNNFLRKNTFNLIEKLTNVSKENRFNVKNEMDRLNGKFNANINKSAFFLTNKVYTSDDLRKDGRMSKEDIEISVEYAYYPDIIEEFNSVNTNSHKIIEIINKIKKITSFTIDNESKLISTINEIFTVPTLINKAKIDIKNTKKDLNSKAKSIFDEDEEKFKNIILAIDSFVEIDIKENINLLKEKYDDYILEKEGIKFNKNKELVKVKTDYDFKKENVDNDFDIEINDLKKLIKLELEESNDKSNKSNKKFDKQINKDKRVIELNEKYKKAILVLEDELKIEKLNINSKFNNQEKTILDLTIESFKKTYDNSLVFNINKQISELNELYSILNDNVIRTVNYIQKLNVLFDFKNKGDKIKNHLYMLNTGDMVLVDTIRRINQKIKRGEKLNEEILYKIIRKINLNKYVDKISEDNIKFIPKDYENLNESQKKAFRLSIDNTDPIAIIQGPPGTGKTEVITNIMKFYRNKGMKVILSSQTNVAIKNVLEKLCSPDKAGNSVIIPWLTTNSKVPYSMSNLQDTWYEKFNANLNNSNLSFVNKVINKASELKGEDELFRDISLINDAKGYAATTTTSVTLPGRGYDKHLENSEILIIDEVSKSILPEILRYALDVKKVILVGDYKQLNPIFDLNENAFEIPPDSIKFRELRKIIQSGVFYELATHAKDVNRIVTLDVNYRSVPGVLDTYNVFYKEDVDSNLNGKGLTGHRTFEEFSNSYKFKNSEYFDSEHSSYFINVVGAKEEKRGTSRYNKGEIHVLIKALHDLGNSLENSETKDVAIIFPYAAQIRMFGNEMNKESNRKLRDKFKSFEWDTVDSFQGSEANIVFLSTVITDANSRNFLEDFRRVNVSMSRAKDMLVILGFGRTLKSIEIGGDAIERDKYFSKILNEKLNQYMKVIKIDVRGVAND